MINCGVGFRAQASRRQAERIRGMGFETPNKEGEGSRLLIRKERVRDS
jgi:hypothetical protein